MRLKPSLILLATFLLSLASCSHGPKITDYISDPSNSGYAVYNELTGQSSFVDYGSAGILKVMSELDEQSVIDYCESKSETDANIFTNISICDNDPNDGGLSCVKMNCAINSNGVGIVCSQAATPALVPYADTAGYIGLSPTDEKTLFDYCDIYVN